MQGMLRSAPNSQHVLRHLKNREKGTTWPLRKSGRRCTGAVRSPRPPPRRAASLPPRRQSPSCRGMEQNMLHTLCNVMHCQSRAQHANASLRMQRDRTVAAPLCLHLQGSAGQHAGASVQVRPVALIHAHHQRAICPPRVSSAAPKSARTCYLLCCCLINEHANTCMALGW